MDFAWIWPTRWTPAESAKLSTIDSNRQATDQRIETLRNEIRVLEHQRNRLAAPNRLPVEILARILVEYVSAEKREYTGQFWKGRAFRWIRIAHVCHRWREVTMNCQEIWSTPLFINPTLAEAMLDRSKNAMLNVNISTLGRLPVAIYDAYLKTLTQRKRIRTLHILGDLRQEGDSSELWKAISGTFPALEELILSGSLLSTFPEGLLASHLPSLVSFKVEKTGVDDWTTFPMPSSLTSLELGRGYNGFAEVDRPPSDVLLLGLEGMPRLETLILSTRLPDDWDEHPTRARLECLKALKTLRLKDNTENVTNFIEAVQIPGTASIDIVLTDEDESWWPTQNLIAHLRISWKSAIVEEGPYELIATEEPGDGLHASTTVKGKPSPTDGSQVAFTLSVVEGDWDVETEEREVAPCYPLDLRISFLNGLADFETLRSASFYMEVVSPIDPDIWRTIFRNSSRLESITIDRYDIEEFISILADDASLSSDSSEGNEGVDLDTALFPGLKILTIEGARLRDPSPDERPQDVVGDLIELLAKRPHIRALSLNKCECLSFQSYRRIQESLPDVSVVWDSNWVLSSFDPS